jgi:hypothetical protein
MYLPLSATLFEPGRPVHPEYTGYAGQPINQADVTLLQYPLGYPPMNDSIAANDLEYYTAHTNLQSFFTGDSSYSVAYLALGNRTAADAQLPFAFEHMDYPHYYVWKETVSGGHLNFITGAGGYLQAYLYGYAGARLLPGGVLRFAYQQPLLPPSATSVKLRGLHLVGAAFDLWYNATTICVEANAGGGAPVWRGGLAQGGLARAAEARAATAAAAAAGAALQLVDETTGQVYPLLPPPAGVCVPLGPVRVEPVPAAR